jgi:D-glycero-alpha-D-manno-heptose-7-phosphate kinase
MNSGTHNVVVVRTPFRISFFGGGTDFPAYYSRKGGQVLATSIDKYGYLIINRLSSLVEEKYRLNYSVREAVNNIEDIVHPAIRGCFAHYGVDESINVNHTADLPAKSGLGSSSAFVVGLIQAIYSLRHQLISKDVLALEAIHMERNVLQERVGNQDQYLCAMGGLRHVHFHRDGSIDSDLLLLNPQQEQRLSSSLMFFYTGINRFASEVLDEQVAKTQNEELDDLLDELMSLVPRARAILENDDNLDEFGTLLHQSWLIKRQLSSKVSNTVIDDIYDGALKAGALGGKLLGAGSGGCLLFYVPQDKQNDVRQALKDLVEIPLGFDKSGSTVLYAG